MINLSTKKVTYMLWLCFGTLCLIKVNNKEGWQSARSLWYHPLKIFVRFRMCLITALIYDLQSRSLALINDVFKIWFLEVGWKTVLALLTSLVYDSQLRVNCLYKSSIRKERYKNACISFKNGSGKKSHAVRFVLKPGSRNILQHLMNKFLIPKWVDVCR